MNSSGPSPASDAGEGLLEFCIPLHPWQHFFWTLIVLQTNFPVQGKFVCKTIPLEILPPKSISGTPQYLCKGGGDA